MPDAPWRKRFTAANVTFPTWARDNPDRLVYATNSSGKWEVQAWDRAAGTHRQVTDRPTGTAASAIDPEGRYIWWWDDTRGNELGRWRREPFEGGPALDAAPQLPTAYMAGLALGRDFAVVGLSLPGQGSRVFLVRHGEEPRLLYSYRGAANVAALSRDDALLAISHTEQGDSLHRALRVLDLEGRVVADLSDGPDGDLIGGDFPHEPADRRLLVGHQRRGRLELLVWDPVLGSETELPIDLPGDLWGDWYPGGQALLVRHTHRGRSELYRFDLGSQALERLPTDEGSVGAFAARPDGEAWYHWASSSTAPRVLAGAGVLLEAPGEKAPGGVSYVAHEVDGVPVFLAEPPGARPHPTLFQVHGGPTGQDSDSFSPPVQAWVDHGYAVVLVNYRGSTGYGKEWRDGNIGAPGPTELEDIAKVRAWVERSGVADPEKIVLSGASWGGYLTLLGLGMQPGSWSLGISGVPIADWLEQYDDVMEPLKAYDRALFGGSPDEIPEVYRRCSPATYVEKVRVPVFILAGENDPRCPVRQINSYVARLEELEKPHEVYRYDAGHGSMVIDETVKQMEMRLAFAAKHLGTPGPA